MLIHKDALAVSEASTPEQTRYFLNGAMFDKHGRAVATNGHVLLRFTSNPIDAENFPTVSEDVTAADDVVVSADSLKAVKAGMAARSLIPALDYMAIVPNGDHVTILSTDLSQEMKIRAKKIGGQFPAYERVLDVSAPKLATVILSPEVLEVVARAARKAGVRSLYLTLHGDAGSELHNQILFTGKGPNGVLDGALMPMSS